MIDILQLCQKKNAFGNGKNFWSKNSSTTRKTLFFGAWTSRGGNVRFWKWKKSSTLFRIYRNLKFHQVFNLWFNFCSRKFIFFCPKFLNKIWIFDQIFYFWPKFGLLTKISIFHQNFDFWPKFRFFFNRFFSDDLKFVKSVLTFSCSTFISIKKL